MPPLSTAKVRTLDFFLYLLYNKGFVLSNGGLRNAIIGRILRRFDMTCHISKVNEEHWLQLRRVLPEHFQKPEILEKVYKGEPLQPGDQRLQTKKKEEALDSK